MKRGLQKRTLAILTIVAMLVSMFPALAGAGTPGEQLTVTGPTVSNVDADSADVTFTSSRVNDETGEGGYAYVILPATANPPTNVQDLFDMSNGLDGVLPIMTTETTFTVTKFYDGTDWLVFVPGTEYIVYLALEYGDYATSNVSDSGVLSAKFTPQANQAPTDITLDNTTVTEGVFENTLVGTLSAQDPNAGDTFTYAFYDDINVISDNWAFRLIGAELRTNANFDYEYQSSYQILLRVSDNGGLTFDKAFTITVTDVANEIFSMLDNGFVRMGDSGDKQSISSSGRLSEPHQYVGANIRGLTDGDDLIDQIAAGGDGSSEWNLNGEILRVEDLKDTTIDRTGFVATDGDKGYGTLVTTGTLGIGGTTLEVKKEYTLGQCTPYVRVKTTFKNIGNSTASNVRYWSPIVYDDELNGDNSPDLKQQGHLQNGAFTEAASPSDRTNAVKVTDTNNGKVFNLLMYTPDASAFALIDNDGGSVYTNDYYDFLYYYLVATDPFNQPSTSLTNNSGSLGIFKRFNDIAVGASDSFEYYFGGSHPDTISFDDMASLMQSGVTSGNAKCVKFNSNGGSAVGAKVVSDGTISEPTSPTKENLTFDGWYTDEALTTPFDFSTTVTESMTLYAKWIEPNAAPTDLSLDTSTIAENEAAGSTVGTLSGTDADADDTLSYSLVSGDGDTDNASFTLDGATLKTGAIFDYETTSSYSIRAQVADAGGLTYAESLTITVTNVNEAPFDISLDSGTVAENEAAGTSIGTFSTDDVDAGDTFTYSLVPGTGDTDNTKFTIDGNTLKTAESLDYESSTTHSILVQTSDAGGLTFAEQFTVTVTDVDDTAPTAPTGLTSSNVQDTSFSVSWNAATDNVGVTGYEVYLDGVPVDTVNATSYSFTGLTPETTYSVTVLAEDAAGNKSILSSALSVSTAIVPKSIVVSDIKRNKFDIEWNFSLESKDVDYEVYVNGVLAEKSDKTSKKVDIPKDLRGQASYTVTIRAKFKDGTFSPFSQPIVVVGGSNR